MITTSHDTHEDSQDQYRPDTQNSLETMNINPASQPINFPEIKKNLPGGDSNNINHEIKNDFLD